MGSVAGYTPGIAGSEDGEGKGSYDPDAVAFPVGVGRVEAVPLPEPEKAAVVVRSDEVAAAEDEVTAADVVRAVDAALVRPVPDVVATEAPDDVACAVEAAEVERDESDSAASPRTPARAMSRRDERILRGRHAGNALNQPFKHELDGSQLRHGGLTTCHIYERAHHQREVREEV